MRVSLHSAWLVGAVLWLLAGDAAAQAPTGWLALTAPPGTVVRAEVEVLPWDGGEGAQVLGRLAVPGRLALPAGRYALRLAGTDFRFGPVAVGAGSLQDMALAAFAVIAPPAAQPAAFFLLDAETSALAARVASNGEPALVLPGEHVLWRDQSEAGQPMLLPPGEKALVELGSLAMDAPSGVRPVMLFLRNVDNSRTLAVGTLPGPPLALLPGRYLALLQGSSAGRLLEVAAGQQLDLPIAGLVARTVEAEPQRYVLLDPDTGLIGLRSVTGDDVQAVLLHGGAFAVVAEPVRGNIDELLAAAPRLALARGELAHVWLSSAGVGLAGQGDVPVEVGGLSSGQLIVEQAFAAILRLAEPASAKLFMRLLTGDARSLELGSLKATPPSASLDVPGSFAGAEEIADGTLAVLAAEIQLADGAILSGQSAPFVVRHVALPAPGGLTAVPQSATRVLLTWNAVPDASGYNVYRDPEGRQPVNGRLPVQGNTYEDLGRSAGRTYRYWVCVVDARGLQGRCGESISVTTTS
jgi:hypothetical protein